MNLFAKSCSKVSVVRVAALTISDCTIPAVPEVPEMAPRPLAIPPINVPGCARIQFSPISVNKGTSTSGSGTADVTYRNGDYCSPNVAISITLPKTDSSTDCLFVVTNNSGRLISELGILGVNNINYAAKTATGVVPTKEHYSRFGVAVEEIPAGESGMCLLCGVIDGVSINVRDNYSLGAGAVVGSTTQLSQGTQGAALLGTIPATGSHNMAIELHLGGGALNQVAAGFEVPAAGSDDALTYVIDRTSSSGLSKTWPPSGGDALTLYTRVKLILPVLVYLPGEGIYQQPETWYWTAALAPVISAVNRSTMETVSC